MTIEAISAIATSQAGEMLVSRVDATRSASTFDSLVSGIQDLNTKMAINQQAMESLAVGDTLELHRVIMSMESTKLSFDLALQIRNKVLDAYQELMRMQI
jgi:flagellar hook-basal body complex protein FliE